MLLTKSYKPCFLNPGKYAQLNQYSSDSTLEHLLINILVYIFLHLFRYSCTELAPEGKQAANSQTDAF